MLFYTIQTKLYSLRQKTVIWQTEIWLLSLLFFSWSLYITLTILNEH